MIFPNRLTCISLLSICLSACQSPTARIHAFADDKGLQRSSIATRGYDHLVITKDLRQINPEQPNQVLHVYLEGDGSPWRARYFVLADPTPRSPLMLELMSLDNTPSVYIGRPCYNGSSQDAGCEQSLWTSARYSKPVVLSMSSALRLVMRRYGYNRVRLFGHSGGGALAMLMAAQIRGTEQVVTLAGNLDTAAWTTHHGYSRLYSSLNPATQPDLTAEISQWHLLGGEDQVIPSQVVRQFIDSQRSATGVLLPHFTHGCCWQAIWPRVLNAVHTGQNDQLPGKAFKQPSG